VLAVGNMDNSIKVYNMATSYALHQTVNPSTVRAWKVDFHPDGKRILCGTTSMVLVNVDDGKIAAEFAVGSRFIYTQRYSSTGKFIASGNIDGGVCVFETTQNTRLCKLEDHGMPVRDLAFAPDDRFLLSVSDDMHINVTDLYFILL
jgi:WD40 repeat protein